MDGWAVLAALKADPDAGRHPGDHAHDRGRQEPGLRAGRRDYLTKPIDRERLVDGARARYRRDRPGAGRRRRRRRSGSCCGGCSSAEGWTVAEAENGRVALERLRGRPPERDPARSDDAGDGRLRVRRRAAPARPAWRAIPVVVVTAKDLTAEDRRAAQRLRASASSRRGRYGREAAARRGARAGARASVGAAGGAREPDGQDPAGRRQRDEPRHALAPPRSGAATRSLIAVDGEQGVAMARAEAPDLILMDMSLPGSTAGRRRGSSRPTRRRGRSRSSR